MREIYRSFVLWWLAMQIPLYGGILYILLAHFNYFWAWLITNTVYAVIMFPVNRRYVFIHEKARI